MFLRKYMLKYTMMTLTMVCQMKSFPIRLINVLFKSISQNPLFLLEGLLREGQRLYLKREYMLPLFKFCVTSCDKNLKSRIVDSVFNLFPFLHVAHTTGRRPSSVGSIEAMGSCGFTEAKKLGCE